MKYVSANDTGSIKSLFLLVSLSLLMWTQCTSANSALTNSLALKNGEKVSFTIQLSADEIAVIRLKEVGLSGRYTLDNAHLDSYNRCFDKDLYNTRHLMLTADACSNCTVNFVAWTDGEASGQLEYHVQTISRALSPQAWEAEITYDQACRAVDKGKLQANEAFVAATAPYLEYVEQQENRDAYWSFLYQRARLFENLLDQPLANQLFKHLEDTANQHGSFEILVYALVMRARWEYAAGHKDDAQIIFQQLDTVIENANCCFEKSLQHKISGIWLREKANYFITFYDYDKSIVYYRKSIAEFTEDGNANEIIDSLNGIGFQYRSFRRLADAAEYHAKAAELLTKITAAKSDIAQTLYYLGTVNGLAGRFYDALQYLRDAREAATQGNAIVWLGHIEAARARYNQELGRFDFSLSLYIDAIKLYERVNATTDLPTPHIHMAEIYSQMGETEKAQKSLDQARLIIGDNMDFLHQRWFLAAETNILKLNGDLKSAINKRLGYINVLENQTEKEKDIFALGRAYAALSELYLENKQYQDALKYAGLALEEQDKSHDDLFIVKSYLSAAEASYELKLPDQTVLLYVEKALNDIERLRSAMKTDALKREYYALQKRLFDLKVRLFFSEDNHLKKDDLFVPSLEAAELFKARTLYESLLRLDGEHSASQEVHGAGSELSKISASTGVNSLQFVKSSFSEENADSKPHKSITAEEIKTYLAKVTEDYVVLYFHQSPNKLYVWAAYQNDFRAVAIDLNQEFYELLGSVITSGQAGESLQSGFDKLRRYEQSVKLSRWILQGVADLLQSGRPVLVVPDGFLHRLPFSALPHPKSGISLVVNHAISYQVSLATDKRLNLRNSKTTSSNKIGLFLVGNPKLPESLSKAQQLPLLSLRDGYYSLPHAEKEVKTIAAFCRGDDDCKTLIGASATKDAFISSAESGFQVIHIAAHADVDWDHPQLSAILFAENQQSGKNNFRLSAAEIANMHIYSEMVVLSACGSATGKNIAGEGPLGLSRAFIEAGTQRVIASLWPVEDEATSYFFKIFYRLVIEQKLAPQIALQQAQISLAKIPKWSHPYYWAPFIYIGNRSRWI